MQSLFNELEKYITLIQLFAGGVYVVYFLDQRIEDPFQMSHKKLATRYNNFFLKYQGQLEKGRQKHFQKLKDKNEIWWENSLTTLSSNALFSFLYCVGVLFYAANEKWISTTYIPGLFIYTCFSIIYIVALYFSFGRGSKLWNLIKKPYMALIFYAIACGLFVNSIYIPFIKNIDEYISDEIINAATLVVCAGGIIIRYLKYGSHYYFLWRKERRLYKLDERIQEINKLFANHINPSVSNQECDQTAYKKLSRST